MSTQRVGTVSKQPTKELEAFSEDDKTFDKDGKTIEIATTTTTRKDPSTQTERTKARIARQNADMKDMHTWLVGLFTTPITKKIVYEGAGVPASLLNDILKKPTIVIYVVCRHRSRTKPSSLSRKFLERLPSATRLKLLNQARLEALSVSKWIRITRSVWAGAFKQSWFDNVPVWGVSEERFLKLSRGASGNLPAWVPRVKTLARILARECGCSVRPRGTDSGLYLMAVVAPQVAGLCPFTGPQASDHWIGPVVVADPCLSSPWSTNVAFTGVKTRKELQGIKKALMGAGVFLYIGRAAILENRVKQHFTGGSTSSCLDTLLVTSKTGQVLSPSSFCVCYFSTDPDEEGKAVKWLIGNGLGWLLLNIAGGDSKSTKP